MAATSTICKYGRRLVRRTVVLASACVIAAATPAFTQTRTNEQSQAQPHQMTMPMTGPLNISEAREGSGTSWLPDGTPMYAIHIKAGEWNVMLHDNAFLQYINEGGDRGDSQVGSVNWFMGMATRKVGGGMFTARAMLSLEPLTVGKCGYPDLLATGELCHDAPLHDRQHPHDLFMELAARYQHELTDKVAFEIYGGPVGEPALGPTAFPHRISALPNPIAPISHHWLDATHISFGVITGGLYGRRWKVEASAFNGREPDENRYDFDLAAFDSYSGRAWFLPNEHWALQISAGHLTNAEQRPGEAPTDVDRITASGTYHRMRGSDIWATTVAWGRNSEPSHDPTQAVLVETMATMMERHIVFGRAEFNQKTGHDLVLPSSLDETIAGLMKLSGGYVFQFAPVRSLVPGIGASVSLSHVPDYVAPFYGGSFSPGVAIFFSLRPKAMTTMAGMVH